MHSATAATLLLNTPSSIFINNGATAKPFFSPRKSTRTDFSACKASQYTPITNDFNLYEIFGIDSSSDRATIKEAYRGLQKRCHPDIAGPEGHEMAIVLNEAYALLSDPVSRMAYDKELEKVSDLQGYTGKPIYSVWLGSESEQRAVFVDEAKCVGCLKCALFAEKTFAIESVYGRARVVAQWADPEYKIQEAIGACPVDCIFVVERSNLAALEFIMSKQPRGKVRIGAGNTAGARTLDVFDEVEKFQARYASHKASTNQSKESDVYRTSRISAIQAIQMISNWIYWKSPHTDTTPRAIQYLAPGAKKQDEPSLKRLKAAAEARKQGKKTEQPKEWSSNTYEYWVPSALELPEDASPNSGPKVAVNPRPYRKMNRPSTVEFTSSRENSNNPLRWGVPMGASTVAAAFVRFNLGETQGSIKDHIGGSLALDIVNSSWLQVVLAGFTWYLIGLYVVEFVGFFRRK
ncbi:hypothetical protein ACJIZ3_002602 [Penstemon smallii]|uniref:J domain-containing protein n=1 Tax=Penstemon smallii TaxID=265156 RepID=A0ABD3U6V6_9LAMI